jgi:hypothetical protein
MIENEAGRGYDCHPREIHVTALVLKRWTSSLSPFASPA